MLTKFFEFYLCKIGISMTETKRTLVRASLIIRFKSISVKQKANQNDAFFSLRCSHLRELKIIRDSRKRKYGEAVRKKRGKKCRKGNVTHFERTEDHQENPSNGPRVRENLSYTRLPEIRKKYENKPEMGRKTNSRFFV